MDQGSKSHLCNLEGGLQRAGGSGALCGEKPLFPTPSSLCRASGSRNRFARNAGEGGRYNTHFRGEVAPFRRGQETTTLFLKYTREWTPKAKGEPN